MKEWLSKFNIVEAGLIGIYLSIVPMSYCGVKIVEGDINEFILMWAIYWMMAGPTCMIMLFNRLAYRG